MKLLSCTPLARRRLLPGRRGLTLVEVLVAVTILSLALLAYLSVIQTSHEAMTDADEFTVAAQAVGNQITQMQGQGYGALTNGTTNYTVLGLPQSTMAVKIGPLDGNAANTNIKQVDITLTWTPRKAGSKAVTATLLQSTLICNR